MKQSRYSDSQIMAILKQAESGVPVPGCVENAAWATQYYKWRSKYPSCAFTIKISCARETDTSRRTKREAGSQIFDNPLAR